MKSIALLNCKIDKLSQEIFVIKSMLQKENTLYNKDETLDIKQAANFLKLSASRPYHLIYANKIMPL